MHPHKFGIGARVRYRNPFTHHVVMTGDFIVSRQMPADDDGYQYCLESPSDGHHRLVHEGDISRPEIREPQLGEG